MSGPVCMVAGHLVTAPAWGISPEGLAYGKWGWRVTLGFLDSAAGSLDFANDNEVPIYVSSGNVFADLDLPEAATALEEFRRDGGITLDELRARLNMPENNGGTKA